VLAAFAQAKKMGMVTIALVGGSGGKMATSPDIDYCLIVEGKRSHSFITKNTSLIKDKRITSFIY
jgi:phosphoheptose isomerase